MGGYIRNVVVFCGSADGHDPLIREQAKIVGTRLAKSGYGVIYGGGTSGLMGIVAEAALRGGAKVKGIIPKIFQKSGSKEQGSLAGADEHIVEDMMVRKGQMLIDSDAGIALPGGLGSLDEIYEMAVAEYLRTFAAPNTPIKPLIVINFEGYYDPLITMMDTMIEKGFLKAEYKNMIVFVDNAEQAVHMLNRFNEQEPLAAKNYRDYKPL
jgi:uncharacterized protein (TIGR00730 family)